MDFSHLKTSGFCGCCAPGTASCGATRCLSTACSQTVEHICRRRGERRPWKTIGVSSGRPSEKTINGFCHGQLRLASGMGVCSGRVLHSARNPLAAHRLATAYRLLLDVEHRLRVVCLKTISTNRQSRLRRSSAPALGWPCLPSTSCSTAAIWRWSSFDRRCFRRGHLAE